MPEQALGRRWITVWGRTAWQTSGVFACCGKPCHIHLRPNASFHTSWWHCTWSRSAWTRARAWVRAKSEPEDGLCHGGKNRAVPWNGTYSSRTGHTVPQTRIKLSPELNRALYGRPESNSFCDSTRVWETAAVSHRWPRGDEARCCMGHACARDCVYVRYVCAHCVCVGVGATWQFSHACACVCFSACLWLWTSAGLNMSEICFIHHPSIRWGLVPQCEANVMVCENIERG